MRRTTRPFALFALLYAAAAAACTLTHDLDELSNGEPDSGRNNLGVTDDGGGQDGTSGEGDSGNSGSGPNDAGGDGAHADAAEAGEVNDAPRYVDGGATYCNGSTTFCADFDHNPLPSGFAGAEGTFLTLTSSRASSAPNDLLLIVPPMSNNSVYASKVSTDFQITANAATLAFDIYPERTTDDGALLIAALDYLGGSAKYSVRFAYFGGQLRIEESYLGSGQIDHYHTSFDVPKFTWSRVRVELAFGSDGGPSTETVFVSEAQVGLKESLSPPAGVLYRPTLHLGAVYGVGPQSGWELRFDNVALDLH